jgi:hypothetical protein
VLREALGNRCCFGDVMQCVRWVLPVESEHVAEYVFVLGVLNNSGVKSHI